MQTNQTAAQKAAGCGSSALCYAALYMILLLPDLESIDIQLSCGRVVPWRHGCLPTIYQA